MKPLLTIIIILLISCQSKENNSTDSITLSKTIDTVSSINIDTKEAIKKDITWSGTINKTISVFIHYQIENEIVVGEITYLNTSEKKPIRLIGTLQDENYRLLEFDKSGNITGIITGKTDQDNFNGEWFSPKNRNSFNLQLTKKDTTITTITIQPNLKEIYGTYSYEYGKEGSQGDFTINKINDNQIAFEIFSVTSNPARNMAIVDKDTIELISNSFVYTIPESEDCEFKVRFYKDFVFINYTKEYCMGQFGHNATIEGIFLKVK
jgi:hypothetical protein